MQRTLRKILVLFVLLVSFLGLRLGAATACVIVPLPTVLDAYEDADVVIIARVVSIEKTEEPDAMRFNVHSATMVVQRVFKGNVKVQDTIRFAQGIGINCLWMFNEEMIGGEYLLYLNPPEDASGLWWVMQGRSTGMGSAANDLLYLNNRDKVRGKTRVSGTLDDDFPVAGRTVRIIGENNIFRTITNEQGVYEIYGLPPGNYRIAPEMPDGWMIDKEDSIPTASERPINSKSHKAFTLRPKRHAVIDFMFRIDNAVEGYVYDQNRRPLAGASIALMSDDGNGGDASQFIDKKGRFRFESFPAGRYKLSVYEDKPGTDQLTRASYYDPQRSKLLTTLIVNLKHGESMRGLKIIVPTTARSSNR